MPKSPESFPEPEDISSLSESPEELRVKAECRDFIESHKEKISDGLARLIKDHKFVLVGERHSPEVDSIRQEIAQSLSELREQGLTNIALELNVDYQEMIDNFDYASPDIKDVLRSKIPWPGWQDGNFDVLIEAKRAGLKVQLIDCDYKKIPGYHENLALWNNERDEKMFSNLESGISEDAKILVYIGSNHVHKKVIEKRTTGKSEDAKDKHEKQEVKRLGTYLAEKYGDQDVASVRFVDFVISDQQAGGPLTFDALPGPKHKIPSPYELYAELNESVILPDAGPIKGDENHSAADYIITMVKSEEKP